jgi:hypothetical protein
LSGGHNLKSIEVLVEGEKGFSNPQNTQNSSLLKYPLFPEKEKKEIPKSGKQPRVPGWHPTPSYVASRPGPSLAALILATRRRRRRECFRAFAAAFVLQL